MHTLTRFRLHVAPHPRTERTNLIKYYIGFCFSCALVFIRFMHGVMADPFVHRIDRAIMFGHRHFSLA